MPLGTSLQRPLSRRGLAVLLLILLVGAVLRSARPGVDVFEGTNAPLLDAYWYLEQASGPVEGSQPESLLGYDIPVWTSLARVWLEVFGVSLGSVQALGACVSLVSVVLLWRILRAGLGEVAALTGAAVLATLAPCVLLSRTTLIYGPVTLALLVATAIWLRARRSAGLARLAQEVAAWVLVFAIALAVRPPAMALLGGLALGSLARYPRLRKPAILVGGLASLGVVALWSSTALWESALGQLESMGGVFAQNAQRIRVKIDPAVTPGVLLGRTLGWGVVPLAPGGSGGFAGLAPAVLGVAHLGGLLALGNSRRLTPARRETLLVFFGWGVLFVLCSGLMRVGDRPLRYYALMGPPLAAFAAFAAAWFTESRRETIGWAGGLAGSLDEPAAPRLRPFAKIAALERRWVACAAVFGAVAWSHASGLLSPSHAHLLTAAVQGAFMGLLVLAVMVAVDLTRRPGSVVGVRVAALLICLSVLPGWVRSASATNSARTYARDANRMAGEVLDPETALLVGPYASFLALGHAMQRRREGHFNTLPARFDQTLERLRPSEGRWATHLAVDLQQEQSAQVAQRFAERGLDLELVAVLEPAGPPAGYQVLIYRFSWAAGRGYALTPFEQRRRLDATQGPLVPEQDLALSYARERALLREGLEKRALALRTLFWNN